MQRTDTHDQDKHQIVIVAKWLLQSVSNDCTTSVCATGRGMLEPLQHTAELHNMLLYGVCRSCGPRRTQIKKRRQRGRAGGERQTGGFTANQIRRAGPRQVQVRGGEPAEQKGWKVFKEAKNNLVTSVRVETRFHCWRRAGVESNQVPQQVSGFSEKEGTKETDCLSKGGNDQTLAIKNPPKNP